MKTRVGRLGVSISHDAEKVSPERSMRERHERKMRRNFFMEKN
jgi:hypothetical protein